MARGGVLQQEVRTGIQCDGHPVERHIPHSLLPTGFLIGNRCSLYACIRKIIEDSIEDIFILAGVVAEVDASIALMIHAPRLCLGRADKGKSRHQLRVGKHLLHVGLHADTVLYQHHHGTLVQKGRQQFRKQVVVDGLQPHQHHVALRHILRILIDIDMLQVKRAVAGIDLHTTFLHKLIVTMRQEVYLLSAISQLAAIIASDGSDSDDSVSHFAFSLQFVCKINDFHRKKH